MSVSLSVSVHLGLSSITQIAASCGEMKFNQYVLPDECNGKVFLMVTEL